MPLAGAANQPKPNVLFVFADQWRAQATGFASDPNVRAPVLDKLAAEGVRFTNAVSTCPVCSPYRASLLTGQYALTHGVFLNDVPLGTSAVSIAQAFKAAGYHTGYIGKWHVDGHGRGSFTPPERRQGFEFWRALECTHAYNRSPYFADDDTKRYWDGYDAIAQTAEAQRYIRDRVRDEQLKQVPFLLMLSWGPPHNPYETAPEAFRAGIDPAKLTLRPNVPPARAAAARKDLAGYYAHIAALDDCLGRLWDTLRETGIERDTIFVFTSDHGDMLGSHGEQRKQRPYDEAIRVPFVLHWPALNQPSRAIPAPIGTPDILPTLLGLSGIEIPKTVEGRDFSAHIRGGPAPDDAALIACYTPFGEWTRANGGREYRGVRTERYTYVRTLEGPWLLFDNESDPYQLTNLCGNPTAAAVQQQLEDALQRKLREARDDFRPGPEYIAKWHYVTDKAGTAPVRP